MAHKKRRRLQPQQSGFERPAVGRQAIWRRVCDLRQHHHTPAGYSESSRARMSARARMIRSLRLQDGYVTFEWARKNRKKVSVYTAAREAGAGERYKNMKPEIHPQYFAAARGSTAHAGNSLGDRQAQCRRSTSTSAASAIRFYTGEQRIVDSVGRVERFVRRPGISSERGPPRQQIEAEVRQEAETARPGGARARGDDPEQAAARGVVQARGGSRSRKRSLRRKSNTERTLNPATAVICQDLADSGGNR